MTDLGRLSKGTGRAALELGCDYLGAEVDERWIAVALPMLGATPMRLELETA